MPPPALRAARIRAATQDPAGGRIERDAAGHPTGTLRDTAAEIALRAEPKPSLDFEVSQLDKAFDTMRAIGITSVQDANTDDHEMQLYRRLYDTHRLNMRVRASFGLKDTHRPADALIGEAIQFRAKWTIDPEFLRADAVKIFADGVVEYPSQTAALLQPYLDAAGHPTNNRGPTYIPQDRLDRIVSAADAAGFTVHIHAIGDRAVRSALDAFADAPVALGRTRSLRRQGDAAVSRTGTIPISLPGTVAAGRRRSDCRRQRLAQSLERQADDYGAALLVHNGMSPALLADALKKLAASHAGTSTGGYLSSHPSTDERMRHLLLLGASFKAR